MGRAGYRRPLVCSEDPASANNVETEAAGLLFGEMFPMLRQSGVSLTSWWVF